MLDLLSKFFTGDKGQKRLMVVIIVWLVLNAYLSATNHQQIASNTALLAQNAVQCPRTPSSAQLPRYIRSQA